MFQRHVEGWSHFTLRGQGLPREIRWAFLLFLVYIVAPVLDVPLLGLSWSAVIFVYLVTAAQRRGMLRRAAEHAVWVRLGAAIVAGVAVSASFAGFRAESTSRGLFEAAVPVVWQVYWCSVFVLVAFLVHRFRGARGGVQVMSWAITGLSLVVLVERAIGAPGEITGLNQNIVGIAFSGFAPLLFWRVARFPRRDALGPTGALAVVLAAAVANTSRGSWLAILFAAVVFVGLSAIAQRSARALVPLVVAGSIGASLMVALPLGVVETVSRRALTFQYLEYDMSVAVRLAMIEKAKVLFREHPIFGVGPREFKQAEAEFDVPGFSRRRLKAGQESMSAHNAYLLLLAEHGLIVGIPYFALLAILFWRGAKSAILLAKFGEGWWISVFAGFAGYSLHLFALAGLRSTAPWVLYGFVAAMILEAMDRRRELAAVRRGPGLGRTVPA